MEHEIEQLKKRVEELEQWKQDLSFQQLTYPLDEQSRQILAKDLILVTGKEGPFVGSDLLSFGIEVVIDNVNTMLYATTPVKPFTANAGTDVCTSTNGAHGLVNGDIVALATTNTLPAGLDTITYYYVVSATATTFKLSLTVGGAAVDITDTGTGTHYFGKPQTLS